MNYDNLSPVLAMMAVQLAQPTVFQKILKQTQQKLHKKLPKRRNRLK
jgi:hypothetical protein